MFGTSHPQPQQPAAPRRPFRAALHTASLWRAARSLALVAVLAALTACATAQGLHETVPETSMEWPLGTEGARVVWVKSIGNFKELGVGKGFWGRAADLFTGGEEEHRIVRPYGVLHDGSGRLYVADPGAGVVHSLDIPRGRYNAIGGGPNSPLVTPIGLAVDDQERLYITDSTSGMVFRYDPREGALKPFLVKRLRRPTGIAFNHVNKTLYISDTLESQLVAVDLNGIERRRLGGPTEGGDGFNHPTDIAVDRIGQIFVTDSLNFRISVLTPEGQVVRQFGAAGDAKGFFSRPKGISVDRAGNVYVSDSLRDAVQVFDAEGNPLLVFGRAGDGRGRFWMPSGLYVDRSDYIFVADTYNKRIQVFRYISGQDANGGN